MNEWKDNMTAASSGKAAVKAAKAVKLLLKHPLITPRIGELRSPVVEEEHITLGDNLADLKSRQIRFSAQQVRIATM